jgi:hypothetical protein
VILAGEYELIPSAISGFTVNLVGFRKAELGLQELSLRAEGGHSGRIPPMP